MGDSTEIMEKLSNEVGCHVLSFEYPGYGMCYKETKDSNVINERALRLYNFLTKEFKYEEKDIIIFGRSIGTGAATELTSKIHPSALILMSPYSSLKSAAKDKSSLVGLMLKDKFNSIGKMKDIKCPILFIHGQLDDVIAPDHSKRLHEEAKG